MTNFFHQPPSPAVRLTAAYVAIIMAVSLFFSIALYQMSTNQLDSSLRHQYQRFNAFIDNSNFPGPPLRYRTQEELVAGQHHLQFELIYFNLVILVLASGASYFLARRTLRPIESSLEAQRRFTADASHELRTPLAAMQSEIEVALRNPKFNASDATEVLHSNLEEISKLKVLSDGLLHLASGSGPTVKHQEVDLRQLVSSAIKQLLPVAKKKKVLLVGSAVQPEVIKGDVDSLRELMIILLDNAIKYSNDGTRVEIIVQKEGSSAVIEVKDQGHGIKTADMPHIFNRFYRSDTARTKQNGNGYGLGLAIAKKIVDAHGGTISVKSQPEQGSTFVVRLPLA